MDALGAPGTPPGGRYPGSPRSARLMTPRHYSRALPHICSPKAPVGAKHARAVLSQTLDDVHWGLAAKSLVGTHRKGKRNEWIRDITERDLPPWSMRGGMGASPKPMSPRTRRVQSLGTGKYCLHSDEHVSKHLAQRYARTPHHRTRPVAPRGVDTQGAGRWGAG